MFYEQLPDEDVKCHLCPNNCWLREGQKGICLARQNIRGKLYSITYTKVSGYSLDPMIKKPINMYKPESIIFSIGSYGCNMHCMFCQNNHIAGREITIDEEMPMLSVDDLIKVSKEQELLHGNVGVAYTYNEPFINYEYVYEGAKKLKEAGLDVVLVTNGNVNKEPLEKILPFVDAMNIDLKTYDENEYRKLGGHLETVKQTIKLAYEKCHVEVTYLAYPRDISLTEDMENIVAFLKGIDDEIPLHISRYFPSHKMSAPPTDIKLLKELEEIASKDLKNVFLGNV